MSARARWAWLPLLGAIALAVAPPAVDAQRRPPGRGPGMEDREQLMMRVRERFAEMIRRELELNDEQARALGGVVREFDEERRAIAREEQAVRRRVEAVLIEEGPAGDEARELLLRMSELRAEEARLFAQEQEALLGVLSPEQVLRFLALRERMAERIRALQGRGPAGRGRGPGPSGGSAPPVSGSRWSDEGDEAGGTER